ncbi:MULTISPECIES: thioredoxin [Dehalobacter]|uniref:Thioredoxin n=2 Tax=Dehalobacter restrictus TaxID=55583 RepID=A0A857DJF5_9FIRM|nr:MULTISPECIES: thioredoxin [Dehalobacter]AHF10136.1 thioredoxin [Dehalobacter restrictus DSM 9455]MCG1025025.1 thioredoxin [Dehalobacter sp.]OCZ52589.1 thioredoxin [Dehalobacter sp. TeCB1]QHA00738.1 thioredoxin [Dehalobacter restrictus]
MAGVNVKTFTAGNWQSDVLSSSQLVLADFWAAWCGPCRMIAPVVEELADEYAGKVTIGKLNVDEQGEIAEKYGVMSIPTLLLIKNGEIVDKIVGFRGKPDLVKAIEAKM